MGNGASQGLQGRHSDSRIDSIRLDGNAAAADSSRSTGNNTFTLRFNVHDYATPDLVAAGEQRKPRARSLQPGDASGVVSTATVLQAVKESRDERNSSALSLADAFLGNNASPRFLESHRQEQPQAEDVYADEAFEDDTIEWKKAEVLGSGSYGTVYLARDERSGTLMAMKEIHIAEEDDADVHNASREVELLRSLRHENVVKYLGSEIDHEAKKLYIFTEWVPGGNLEQNRKRFGCGERVICRFTRQILQGVAFLHSRSIIHHDIKPSNLLVDQHGVVKLADFGSSRLISSSTCINNESMRGTPNYMAPEVIKQSGRSRKSDIWSVGCSVLRLLTGHALWGDKKFDSQIALLYYIAHLESIPVLPAELSDQARSFIVACLEIDPSKRPTAEELLRHPFVTGGSSSTLTLPTKPPVVLPERVLSAPAESGAQTREMSVSQGRGLATAPAIPIPATSLSPLTSLSASNGIPTRSHLVSTRFPGHGYFDDRSTDHDEATLSTQSKAGHRDGNPETVSFRTKTGKHGARLPTSEPLPRVVAIVQDEDDDEDIYTYTDFAPSTLGGSRSTRAGSSSSQWEDQPILTDAAREERERQLARTAEEKRKRDERERIFQEELVEFRRHVLHSLSHQT